MKNTNSSILAAVLPLIPPREPRLQSGTRFALPEANARHGTQVAQLARFLQWLTPLNPVSKEEQQVLGLLAPRAKSMLDHDDDEGGDRDDLGAGYRSPLERGVY